MPCRLAGAQEAPAVALQGPAAPEDHNPILEEPLVPALDPLPVPAPDDEQRPPFDSSILIIGFAPPSQAASAPVSTSTIFGAAEHHRRKDGRGVMTDENEDVALGPNSRSGAAVRPSATSENPGLKT
ncbi:hypothetical protein CF327_g7523 [Tilletia walkeri]|nr:hypothetical protein CF327_g7523 [Tilletia walkeri]